MAPGDVPSAVDGGALASDGGPLADGGAPADGGSVAALDGGRTDAGIPPSDAAVSDSPDAMALAIEIPADAVLVGPAEWWPAGAPRANTIAAGLELALREGKRRVLVAAGTYEEQVHVVEGIDLVGGHEPTAGMAAVGTTEVRGGNPALVAEAVLVATEVRGFVFRSAGGVEPSESSYGAFVVDSPGLVLHDVELVAGRGAKGADGVRPAAPNAPAAARAGESSTFFCSHSVRGFVHQDDAIRAAAPTGAACARGGEGATLEQAASDGHACGGAGAGARGDGVDEASAGAVGAAGAPGAGAAPGGFAAAGYVASSGGSGEDGDRGAGGGGGAVGDVGTCRQELSGGDFILCYFHGAPGGAGGTGGRGGQGGEPGGGGGGSFGLYVVGAAPSLSSVRIEAGVGGDGGAGAPGGLGAAGGAGGAGGLSRPPEEAMWAPEFEPGACDPGDPGPSTGEAGAAGGDGGRGGPGGGGAGGPSVALVQVGDEAPVALESVSLHPGRAGYGGVGGAPLPELQGRDGAAGERMSAVYAE